MVASSQELPALSWPELVTEQEAARLAGEIVALLVKRLRPLASDERRVFGIVPTPTLPTAVEAAFLQRVRSADGEGTSVRVVPLARGRCYVLESDVLFHTALPVAFEMGPPELTMLALNVSVDMAGDAALAHHIAAALSAHAELRGQAKTTGLHFDSGDLVEVF